MPPSGPNWAEILEAVGTAVSAVVSVVLLYVAVTFRDEARAARRRPELTLSHDPGSDGTLFHDPHWNYDLHLRARNKLGQDRALQVSLELVGIRPLGDTAPLTTRPPLRPFAVAELLDYESTEVDIPANVSRRFLFVYHDTKAPGGQAELGLRPRAQSGRDRLPPGRYELTLALTSANTAATYWSTTVTFAGITDASEQDTSRLTVTSPVRVTSPDEAA